MFPLDVDVDKPDEKSIMTYVAKFLEKYPAGDKRNKVGPNSSSWENGQGFSRGGSGYSDSIVCGVLIGWEGRVQLNKSRRLVKHVRFSVFPAVPWHSKVHCINDQRQNVIRYVKDCVISSLLIFDFTSPSFNIFYCI